MSTMPLPMDWLACLQPFEGKAEADVLALAQCALTSAPDSDPAQLLRLPSTLYTIDEETNDDGGLNPDMTTASTASLCQLPSGAANDEAAEVPHTVTSASSPDEAPPATLEPALNPADDRPGVPATPTIRTVPDSNNIAPTLLAPFPMFRCSVSSWTRDLLQTLLLHPHSPPAMIWIRALVPPILFLMLTCFSLFWIRDHLQPS